jgi:hypothetical protein
VVVLLLGVIAISSCFLLRMESLRDARDHYDPGRDAHCAHPVFHRGDGSPLPGRRSGVREPYRAILEKIMVPEFGAK